MMFLLLLLFISPAQAQIAPPPSCTVLPTVCPPPNSNRMSCTFQRSCVDSSGCVLDQTLYIQDCSPTPTPKYCSSVHTFVVRSRKQVSSCGTTTKTR
jgi:hypothetical protein